LKYTPDLCKKPLGFTKKLIDKEIIFYQRVIGSLYQYILDCGSECLDLFDDNLKLFNRYSPQQRLSLLAELSIGLFDNSQHLPNNTLELFSAFYAIHNRFLLELSIEIDTFGDGTQKKNTDKINKNTDKINTPTSNESINLSTKMMEKLNIFEQRMEDNKIEKVSEKKRHKRIKKAMKSVEIDEENIDKEKADEKGNYKEEENEDAFAKILYKEEENEDDFIKILYNHKNSLKRENEVIDEDQIIENSCTFRHALHDILRDINPNFPSFAYNYEQIQEWHALHRVYLIGCLHLSESGLEYIYIIIILFILINNILYRQCNDI
jgi:hypothetical protein